MVESVEAQTALLQERIQKVYLADEIPWVVGYSGGKDSTATLQLVWQALADLPSNQRKKTVHVISTDTLVEQPLVAVWVNRSLELMMDATERQNLPIIPHRLTPEPNNSFWVNLIGKGYPTPRQGFRWCTSRLKIEPSNRFIKDVVQGYGEAILVLGTRKSESIARGQRMELYEKKRIREWLSPNMSLANSWVFSPIELWSNDDVWEFLMTYENPWGRSNRDLLDMYRGANPDNECPLVVDTTTPSCGGSRFGCWVCTVVAADKSMEAMIRNDAEKSWMTPLLALRNELGKTDADGKIQDRDRRDFRRLDGNLKLNYRDGKLIHGPYTRQQREYWLRRLLEVQQVIRQTGPADMRTLELISQEELRAIRRIWLEDKHEFLDRLPVIWEEVMGVPYFDLSVRQPLGTEEWELLETVCGSSGPTFFEMQASLLDVVQRTSGSLRSSSLVLDDFIDILKRGYYDDEADALAFAESQQSIKVIETPDPYGIVQSTLFDGLTS